VESHGLGLFVRSLVGLDRSAAKDALAGFLAGKALAANQIEFVNLIVNHLTEHGVMEATLLMNHRSRTSRRAGQTGSSVRDRWIS
jgi:type I site-specific restriction endonuclease